MANEKTPEYRFETVAQTDLQAFLDRECKARYGLGGAPLNVPWQVHTIDFGGGSARLLLTRTW